LLSPNRDKILSEPHDRGNEIEKSKGPTEDDGKKAAQHVVRHRGVDKTTIFGQDLNAARLMLPHIF